MIGVLASLGSACLWALTNTLVKLESDRLDVVAINAYRAIVGSLLFLVIFLLTRDVGLLLTLPLEAVLALLLSVVAGMAFGDTLNFRSMLLIGLSRSFPIAGSYPLFTLVLSAIFLREDIGAGEVAGCLVTLTGVMLVAMPGKAGADDQPLDAHTNLLGVAMALGAAALWAASSTIVKVGLAAMDVITASTIRLPAAAAVLWLLLLRGPPAPMPWQLRGRSLLVVLATGILGSGLSSYFWLLGVQEIGAARAAILTSTSPIFGVALSFLILGERPARRVLAGTLLSVAGIVLIV